MVRKWGDTLYENKSNMNIKIRLILYIHIYSIHIYIHIYSVYLCIYEFDLKAESKD